MGTKEKPFRTIQECISEINDQIRAGDFVNEGYVINLMSNITFCEADYETDNGMINISVSNYSTSASISTDKNITLTIKGDSQKRTIDALYNSRVLNVNGDKLTLNLENLVIENGVANSDSGAGINITSGTLNLTNVDICSCTAAFGAGLYINKDGNCFYNSGKIYSNTAVKNDQTGGDGSGIYVTGKLTLGTDTDAVVITDNKQYGNGAVWYLANNDAKVTLKNAEVLNNYKIIDESTKEKSNFYFDYDVYTNAIVISGMLSKTKISITTEKKPTKEEKVAFARVDYDDFFAHGEVDPWKYFTLDKLGYNDIEKSNDGFFNLVIKQGSVISDPFYIKNPSLSVENISNENLSMEKVDGVLYIPFGTSNRLEFELQAEETEGQLVSVSGTKNWNFTLYTANEKIGLDKGLYSFKDNVLTLNSNLPAQEYYLDVQFTLASGRPYNESIKILQNTVANCETAPTTGTYTISSDAELEKLKTWVNKGDFVNESGFVPLPEFVLQCDLTLSGTESIGKGGSATERKCFNGVFDGNGHTITNKTGYPLFAIASGEIKNLTVRGEVTIAVPWSDGATLRTIGGVVAWAAPDKELIISNCINYSDISFDSYPNGGIIGSSAKVSATAVKIINCKNFGDIGKKSSVSGGIIGESSTAYNITSKKGTIVINCSNYGNIMGCYAGGITGKKGALYNCVNYGTITGCSSISTSHGCSGGIIGFVTGNSNVVNIKNCINYGDILGGGNYPDNTYTGQIYGDNDVSASYKEKIIYTNCFYLDNEVSAFGQEGNHSSQCNSTKFSIKKSGTDYKSLTILGNTNVQSLISQHEPIAGFEFLSWYTDLNGMLKLNYQD